MITRKKQSAVVNLFKTQHQNQLTKIHAFVEH